MQSSLGGVFYLISSDAVLFSRDVTTEDEEFRFQVYCSTRQEEMNMWGWDVSQQEAFLRMQFHMQQLSYKQQYPEAHYQIVMLGEQPIGHILIVHREEYIILADIAFLPEYRNMGFASSILKKLQNDARKQNKAIKLNVIQTNPAIRLYERLGFIVTGDNGLHNEMVWQKEYE